MREVGEGPEQCPALAELVGIAAAGIEGVVGIEGVAEWAEVERHCSIEVMASARSEHCDGHLKYRMHSL